MITEARIDEVIFNAIKRAKPLVTVCSWCPDARQRTADEIAKGHDVTHGMCPACAAKF